MSTPNDRLPYADCTHIEAALSAGIERPAGDGDLPADANAAKPAPALCPLCQRDRAAALSVEALDVLQFRFWSADHRQFDHIGFARAVMAACAK